MDVHGCEAMCSMCANLLEARLKQKVGGKDSLMRIFSAGSHVGHFQVRIADP